MLVYIKKKKKKRKDILWQEKPFSFTFTKQEKNFKSI